jgi:hypothetical protein
MSSGISKITNLKLSFKNWLERTVCLGMSLGESSIAILQSFSPTTLYNELKSFYAHISRELEDAKIDLLKEEHRKEFINLQAEYYDLICVTNAFCDNALPIIKLSMKKLEKAEVDFDFLLRKATEIDPTRVMEDCQKLQKRIQILNDTIATDGYYKTSWWKGFGKIFMGSLVIVGVITLVVLLPFAWPLEIALVAAGLVVVAGTVSGMVQLFKGFTGSQLANDVKTLLDQLVEASKNLDDLKAHLSKFRTDRKSLIENLEEKDRQSLKGYYDSLLKSINEIRDICLRPVKLRRS